MKKVLLSLLIALLGFVLPAQASTTRTMHTSLVVSPYSIGRPGYTPTQIRNAYGIASLGKDGSGQIIAIVDAYHSPTITTDVAVFSHVFNLPSANLQVVSTEKASPHVNAGWASEASLDVEWAHAIAPKAAIILVETKDASLDSLLTGVDLAVSYHPNVISMSWGGIEFANETAYDNHFNHPGISFVASSGDSGHGISYPAVSPSVLAVGGTTLSLGTTGNELRPEQAWAGSGGGISHYETQPTYQKTALKSTFRSIPDVSYNADPSTGYAVYDSTPYQGASGWVVMGGTSAGAPQWAALISLLRQTGQATTNTSFYTKKSFFNDITIGKNGTCALCSAIPGYDSVTGLGTPNL